MKNYRCEQCLKTFPDDQLKLRDEEWRCPRCVLRWYALAVEMGEEKKIAKEIARKALIEDMEHKLTRVLVPTHKEILFKKDGSSYEASVVTYEGYVLLEMDYDGDLHHLLKDTKGVFGLVPSHERPTALQTKEAVELLLREARRKAEKAEGVKLKFKVGDRVTVKGGIWKGQEVTVKHIGGDKTSPMITVDAVVFGQPVEVELNYWEIDR